MPRPALPPTPETPHADLVPPSRYRHRPWGTALAVAILIGAAACAPTARTGPALEFSACRLPGIDRSVRCGSLSVPEDRASPQGRRIDIQFAVIPARGRAVEPDPLVVLAGGPGQGAMALAAQVSAIFGRLNDTRDIVLVDQRGTGQSHPLDCDPGSVQSILEETLPEDQVRDCLQSLDADPRHYATPPAMADLDEILGKLGYAKVNLWGGSYGTRAALDFLRRYPGRVRTVTLDGVAPATMKLPYSFAADGEAAFERLLGDCEAQPACQRAYPSLRHDAGRLRTGLARLPARAAIEDPLTGEPEVVSVTQGVFLTGLFRPLYAPEIASLLPLAITRAAGGDFNPLLAPNLEFTRGMAENLSVGMHLAVVCSEDVPRITEADVEQASRTFFGGALVHDFLGACRQWPVASLPPDYHEPVRSPVPVLILSGGIDPATPPRHGDLVAATLPNAKHLVAPNLSHGVSSHGCAPRLIERFIRAGDASRVDGECLAKIPRPLFFLPPGARP